MERLPALTPKDILVMMPDVDGGDVAAMLAGDREFRDVPIVFLTALVSGEEVPSGGMANREHRMLPKSTPIDALIRIIDLARFCADDFRQLAVMRFGHVDVEQRLVDPLVPEPRL